MTMGGLAVESNIDVIKRFFSAWGRDWESACREFMTEDFECHEPPGLPQSGVFKGWDTPIRISNIYRAIWDVEYWDMRLSLDESGEVVTTTTMFKWTHKKTGKSCTEPVTELNYFRGGKICKMVVYHFDLFGVVATMQP
jgi:ketosteroid isomerase-like protein